MKRNIIKIDGEKCDGCGLCASACHEGAIGMENGKAKLLREDYCDGLGDCLPACPQGAITFEEREVMAYNAEAVMANKKGIKRASFSGGCPGSQVKYFSGRNQEEREAKTSFHVRESCLKQWPVQIQLVPIMAPYFDGAKLLIAADCTAFAYGNFHEKPYYFNRLPQIRSRRVFRKAYSYYKRKFYKKCCSGANGSAMLRRHVKRCCRCFKKQRENTAMADHHHFYRREDSGLSGRIKRRILIKNRKQEMP